MCSIHTCLSVIEELRNRFDHLLKTGDNSRIPADLLNITYKVAGQYGGQAEWDLFASSYSSSSAATVRRASMIGLGAFQEDKYIDQTFAFMETKAKDQDLVHFFMALASNFKYRRYSTRKFKESFDAVSIIISLAYIERLIYYFVNSISSVSKPYLHCNMRFR